MGVSGNSTGAQDHVTDDATDYRQRIADDGRLLRVIESAGAAACSFTVDDDVPLSWRCADALTPLYWRTGDLNRSLLEIGLVPEGGRLCKVTVVLANGCLRPDDGMTAAHLASASPRTGLPCCDIRPWLNRHTWPAMRSWESREGPWMFEQLRGKERIIDAAALFTLTITADGVSVWLGDPVPLAVCYVTPTLWSGVASEGDLRLLHFGGLHDDERARLVVTLAANAGANGMPVLRRTPWRASPGGTPSP